MLEVDCTEFKNKLLKLLERELLLKDEGRSRDINTDKLDSLSIMSLLVSIENDLSIEIDLEKIDLLTDFSDVEKLLKFLISNSKSINDQ